jgi:phospholipid/cholesterol/gamma-HCH transport system substrate-binding protein
LKKLITPLRVGLFVVAAGAFLFTFIMFSRKGGLSDRESIDVYALFRDASGLGPKSRVQIAGIPVGEIRSITLEGTRARVNLRIRRDVDLREDASLTKRSESLLGDFLLDLSPGTDAAPPMQEGGQIKRVLDSQGLEAVFESLSRITGDIEQVTRALRDVLGGEKGTGSMQRIVENMVELSDAVDDTVRTSGERLNTILLNFQGVSEDVRGLFFTDDDLRSVITAIPTPGL